MVLLSGFLLSLLMTVVLVPLASRLALRFKALDIPDGRKVHDHPIPRSGGLAMAVGAFLPVIFLLPKDPLLTSYLLGSAIIVFFGVIDDFKGLNWKGKFGAQIAAALVVVLVGGIRITKLGFLLPDGWLLPGWIAIPLTIIIIVGITNAINLADGLDGLAGGITLLCFACVAYLAHGEGQMSIMIIAVCLAGTIFGFLRFNTYPARIFMGDTGSQFLGFSAIILCLMLTQDSTPLSPLLPLIILGFPILDTMVVMAQRVTEGRPVFSADKNHFHHRLMEFGLYHTEAVMAIYVMQGSLIVMAILLRYHSEWFLLLWYMVFSSLVVAVFFCADRTNWKLRRFNFVDNVVKGRLRALRGHRYVIRVSFTIVQYGLPTLLFATCFMPAQIPAYLSIASGIAIAVLLTTRFLRRSWKPYVLMATLYLLTPFLVFLSTEDTAGWMNSLHERIHDLSFVALVFFVIATLKFTKRKQGFVIKPTDLLVLFITVAAPFVLREFIKDKHIPYIATKIVVFFFSYEVLVGELRGEYGKLTAFTVLTLAVVAVRGIFG